MLEAPVSSDHRQPAKTHWPDPANGRQAVEIFQFPSNNEPHLACPSIKDERNLDSFAWWHPNWAKQKHRFQNTTASNCRTLGINRRILGFDYLMIVSCSCSNRPSWFLCVFQVVLDTWYRNTQEHWTLIMNHMGSIWYPKPSFAITTKKFEEQSSSTWKPV